MSSPILFSDPSKCCGCGACSSVCPQNAITMKMDENGYCYPVIDSGSCVECSACKTVCNFQNGSLGQTVLATYAAISKDSSIREVSSSGGVFAALAQAILDSHGIIYGCAYVRNGSCLDAVHIRVDKSEDISKIQGTKYVQSDTSMVYSKVKEDLTNGKVVLFTGTPCQVDGLGGFLHNKKYENLYTLDILCHGVPSKGLFQDYIRYLERSKKATISELKFRDKKYGWGAKGSIDFYKNGQTTHIRLTPHDSSYYRMFLDAAFFRENCYSCKYASTHRVGDITIGDFWGFSEEHPDIVSQWNVSKGVSCLMINSEKGKELIEKYGNRIIIERSDVTKVIKHNSILSHPCKNNKDREEARRLYREYGYAGIEKWWKKKQGFKRYLFLIKNSIMRE